MAYNFLEDIIDVIRDSVDIIDIKKPVYNFKASDEELLWEKKKEAGSEKERKQAYEFGKNISLVEILLESGLSKQPRIPFA